MCIASAATLLLESNSEWRCKCPGVKAQTPFVQQFHNGPANEEVTIHSSLGSSWHLAPPQKIQQETRPCTTLPSRNAMPFGRNGLSEEHLLHETAAHSPCGKKPRSWAL
jgi:hypothetical protein